jgi:heme-degrading monooxygenase HmoA
MFARLLELTIKPSRKSELTEAIDIHILPMFKNYRGFFDVIPLEVESDPTKFYVVSLWHDRREAERFHRDDFPKEKAVWEPFLLAPIIVKLCYVDERIPKKLTAAVAA